MTHHGNYIDLLLKMLAIPSISRKEGPRADLLERYIRESGSSVSRKGNNIIVGAQDRESGLKTLLLNSHIDTVPPSDDWTVDPFDPVVRKGKITGLGSNDAGASVISLLGAYEILKDELGDRINLILVLSAEEEVSGKDGLAAVLPDLGKVDGAIVGEPTGMQPAVAERGLMVIDAMVSGKAGHAARNEGENAIYKAMVDIENIKGLTFDQKSIWLPDPSAQVTMIEAGKKHNMVPESCHYVIDVRSNDLYDNRQLLDLLQSVSSGTLTPRSLRLSSSSLPEKHFLFKAIHHAGLKPFGSLTLSDMAVIPFPAIKMGPGDSARSHTADEYILTDEIENGISEYVRFIRSVANILKKEKHEAVG